MLLSISQLLLLYSLVLQIYLLSYIGYIPHHSYITTVSRRTHQLIAEVTLNSKLSFCTAMSMRATTSPESELAVSLIRSVHRWSSLCISAGQKLAKYRFIGNKVLTL